MHLITWINDQRCENLGTDSEVRIIPFRAGGRGAAMFGFPASTIDLRSKPEAQCCGSNIPSQMPMNTEAPKTSAKANEVDAPRRL